MDGHASPAKLPAVQEFLGAFQVRFRWPEGREALERSTTGRRTELSTKHCETSTQAVRWWITTDRVIELCSHRI